MIVVRLVIKNLYRYHYYHYHFTVYQVFSVQQELKLFFQFSRSVQPTSSWKQKQSPCCTTKLTVTPGAGSGSRQPAALPSQRWHSEAEAGSLLHYPANGDTRKQKQAAFCITQSTVAPGSRSRQPAVLPCASSRYRTTQQIQELLQSLENFLSKENTDLRYKT